MLGIRGSPVSHPAVRRTIYDPDHPLRVGAEGSDHGWCEGR